MLGQFLRGVFVRNVHVVIDERFVVTKLQVQNCRYLVSEVAKNLLDLFGPYNKLSPALFVAF
jgi:hypothetical protein